MLRVRTRNAKSMAEEELEIRWRELIQGFLSLHPSNEMTSAEGNIETPLEQHSF